MPCAPRHARTLLSRFEEIAKQSYNDDFRHSIRYDRTTIIIHTGPDGSLPPTFTKSDGLSFVDRRFVLQLIQTYGSDSR